MEHFQIKWGQAYLEEVICPPPTPFPDLNSANVSAKSKWGQIFNVPIFSDGLGANEPNAFSEKALWESFTFHSEAHT